MKYGVIWYSTNGNSQAKPITLNITVWVYFDITPHLVALNKPQNRRSTSNTSDQKVKEIFEKEYGVEGKELLNSFESIIDCS